MKQQQALEVKRSNVRVNNQSQLQIVSAIGIIHRAIFIQRYTKINFIYLYLYLTEKS